MLGENADLDELVMPIERDRVPPAAPINWRESPASTYSAATRMSTVNLAFDGPQETDLEQVEVIVTINGVTQPMIRLARGILTLALVMLPSATWSAYASARDTSGNKSGSTATLTGTAAAMVAEVPGPPATVTLAGLRTGIDTWQANVSWSAGTGGTGTAATYEVRYYKTASGAASATILPVPPDNRVMLINGLALGVGYTINVRSVTAWGDRGGWSSGSTLTFSGETPGVPTISSVSSAKGAITFNIGKPTTGTGLTNIDRYSIAMAWYNGATLLGKEERIISYAGDPTAAAWMGVERGATYKFTVTALTRFNDVGTASAQTTYSVPAPTVEQTLYNPGFEIAALNNPTLPDGWNRNDAFNHVWSRATDQWYGGAASLKVVSGSNVGVGFSFEAQSQPFVVRPNTAYQITTMMRYNIATTTNQGFRVLINWLDNTGAAALPGYSTAVVSGLTANTWNTVPITSSLPFVSPANAASAYILIQFTGATGLTGWIDDITVTRAAAPNEITTGVIDLPSKFGSAMAAIQKGTNNPASPSADDQIWRTDIRRHSVYDGTRWITPDVKILAFDNTAAFTAITVTGTNVGRCNHNGDLDWLLYRFAASVFVATTNNASNYWTLTLRYITAGNTITNVATITTAAIAANTWNRIATNTFSPATAPATSYMLEVIATLTGSPGSLLVVPQLLIREIIP